jgi:hypothetical protein
MCALLEWLHIMWCLSRIELGWYTSDDLLRAIIDGGVNDVAIENQDENYWHMTSQTELFRAALWIT